MGAIRFLALGLALIAVSCSDQVVDAGRSGTSPSAVNKTAKQKFSADLTGASERPVPVTTDATGTATFKLSKDGTSMDYKLSVHDMDHIFGAHIHVITSGEIGGVVVHLYSGTPGGEVDGTLVHGTFDASDLVGSLAGMTMDDLLAAIEDGRAYVNVHSSEFPGGEIRGTLLAD